jgi:hypothetical protein
MYCWVIEQVYPSVYPFRGEEKIFLLHLYVKDGAANCLSEYSSEEKCSYREAHKLMERC